MMINAFSFLFQNGFIEFSLLKGILTMYRILG